MIDDVQILTIDQYCLGLDRAENRLDRMFAALEDTAPVMRELLDDFQRHTAQWMLSEGDGTYPPLEASTVANKVAAGYPLPGKPLFATGALFASAIGDGPYTVADVGNREAFEAIDWERDGWNIAALHQTGVPWELVHRRAYVTRTGAHVRATSYMWHLPARPIFEIDQPLIDLGADQITDHIFQP